jgi:hypothetical protein
MKTIASRKTLIASALVGVMALCLAACIATISFPV